MSIAFNEIPADVRVPGVLTEVDGARAISGAQIKPMRVVMFGGRITAGTVAQKIPKKVTSVADARTWFGAGSMLHGMVAAYLANKHEFDLTCVALDDAGGGTAASLAITVTASATPGGTIYLYIGGYRVALAVAASTAQNTIATNLAAAINALEGCPVTAGVSTNVVTLTCRHKGAIGNEIDVRVNYYEGEALPSGVALSNVPGNLASGATNPTMDFTMLGEEAYDLFIIPWTDTTSLTAINAELDDRWSPERQIEASHVAAKRDTHANLLTFGAALNSKFHSVIGIEGMVDPPWEVAAEYGAVRSYYSKADPARPLRGLPLKWTMAPTRADRFSYAERELLYRSGVTPVQIAAGDVVQLERTITTYRTNAAGAADIAFLDTTTVDTLAYLRWSFRNRMLLRFARHKLVGDGTRPGSGQAVVTPKIARGEAIALFEDWMDLQLVEDIEQFKRDLIVEINGSDPTRLDMVLPINVANPLYIVAAKIEFRL